MKKTFRHHLRIAVIMGVFLLIMVIYFSILLRYQIEGNRMASDDDNVHYTRTVTVSGLRGEIYDRNGKLLVGNSTAYDLRLEYGAIPDTTPELNRSILNTLEALDATGNRDVLCLDYNVFVGTYPDIEYCDAVYVDGSNEAKHLSRVLDANGLHPTTTQAETLVAKLVQKYKLSDALYTNEEITDLLLVRYAMERVQFGPYQPYTMATDVSMELVSYLEEENIEGINLIAKAERVYHYPGYASHILGRLGKITEETLEYYQELGYPMDALVGTSGCEQAFESYLRGQDGTMLIKYDMDGNVIEKVFETEPISGQDIYLTLDIDLQIVAEDSLDAAVSDIVTANSGAMVAMIPQTGEVLAIASNPTYDLTQFENIAYYNQLLEDENKPLLNRALQGAYAPGSVYKVGSAMAALETGTVTAATEFSCNCAYTHTHHAECVGSYPLTGNTCLGLHGNLTVTQAIAVSCNNYFYEVGHLMGVDAITSYTKHLGLGVSTGIELGEVSGLVGGFDYAADWNHGSDILSAIGQMHSYTPLQLGVYMSSIVNGGTRMNAHLLDSVHTFYDDELTFSYTPTVADSVTLSDTTLALLRRGMQDVVHESTHLSSYFADIPGGVAGKTGTAEVTGQEDNALFAGYAPYDAPEIVVACIIEEGKYGYLAGSATKDVFAAYFELKNADASAQA